MIARVERAFGPGAFAVGLAFLAVYLIWGSTYLAIRFAIETLPPFLMAAARFLVAGAVLYAWARARGAPAPTRAHWLSAAVVGGLLLVGGNGGVVWAEQHVPSGLAALLVATVPLWMVLLDGLRTRARPSRGVVLGLVAGFAGVGLLLSPGDFAGGGRVHPLGSVVLLGAAFSWALGSLYSRRAHLPASPLVATAMEMLAGGAGLLLAGTVTGEWSRVDPGAVSARSLGSLGYLIAFGSLIGFSCYIWLLRVSTPARVSTYAYVNPVVAVLLGWAFAGESLSPRTLLAMAIVVSAVVLITTARAAAASGGAARAPRRAPAAALAPAAAPCTDDPELPLKEGLRR